MLQTTLDRFSAALSGDPDASMDDLLTPASADGLAIYRSAAFETLHEVLRDHFPTVLGLLGERNFRLFAWRYSRAHPSRTDSVSDYGAAFPAFLAEQPEIAQTQPALVHFAWADFALLHPAAAEGFEVALPSRLLAHRTLFLTEGRLGDFELGELETFRFERQGASERAKRAQTSSR